MIVCRLVSSSSAAAATDSSAPDSAAVVVVGAAVEGAGAATAADAEGLLPTPLPPDALVMLFSETTGRIPGGYKPGGIAG